MATVITNMLSAIPWIGQDFVQFVFQITPVDYEVFILSSLLATNVGLSFYLRTAHLVRSSTDSCG